MSGNDPEDDIPGGAAALGGAAMGAPRPGGAGHLDDGVPAPGEAGGIPRPLPVPAPAGAPGRPPALGAALREAVLAALVALGLFLPLVGLRTEPGEGGLVLRTRWADVAILVALAFAGRFLLALWHRRHRSAAQRAWSPRLPSWIGRVVAPLLLLLGLALPFLPGVGRYELDLAVLVATYVMLGWGLNIVVGLAGLLDLGYVAFYAVGAYAYALLALNLGLSFWICLPLAGILAAFWGVILGFPVLRLRGDYLAIVTLAFGEIIRIVLINWVSLTGGPNGLSGIPRPTFFGLEFGMGGGPDTFAGYFGLTPSPLHRVIFLYYLILALALLTNWVTLRLRRQPLGRAWEALREDEIAARALGINITTTKLTAFALGAMFGGFAGAFFATRQAFISPESFTFIESAIILAIVVLGGLGSQLGVAIAALVMIGGFEVFRDLQEWRMLVFGVAMVTIMVWRPRGLISTRRPTVSLGKARAISGDLVGEGRG
ncbi:Branched-chain amino acid transport system permease protein livM [Roseomonas mucosa]|uniref:Leucine/isoleucine/valine transporter permease subunit n=2 Tax=Roseomonas TaxID=125216 RepID=A0A379N0D9_9PROT|nr:MULTISPECIES: high-affinity branched-chain amino acid ABC transporter permease LivM [Roseomonas]AWV22313.1 Branched-chain amino acid transport system permease protein livM [Roseomonas mucosa]MCG7352120.1 high-affinity branched-chain amino acid ABC transporter permease LivM [Roseomonas mucosa]MCG7355155.1 high-affinity branched-chain amino acid ABC transporter permease LivM [Roseomonas mucosa]MDT8288707.1 high-affinity branched-chain amino acid ABC transporter permease LivM [Roseomonas mucosa